MDMTFLADRAPPMVTMVAAALAAGAVGLCAGAGARLALGRLPRGARVPAPWCEVAVGALWAAGGCCWAAGALPGRWLPLVLGVGWLAVAAGAVDLIVRRLPDGLTLPALPGLLALGAPLGPDGVGRAALGAAVLFTAHLLVRIIAPTALGGGDVKLAAPVGAALACGSWAALVVGVTLAAGITAAVAVGQLAGRSVPAARGLPHGMSLVAATWLVTTVSALSAAAA